MSRPAALAGAAAAATSGSATTGTPCAGDRRPTGAGTIVGIGSGVATCMAPRCCGLLEMRIFIPLSEVISIESTLESSMMSISFLTYRRSIIGVLESHRSPELDQLVRESREDSRTVRREKHVVLDAHATPACPIDPRLDRHHRTLGQRAVRRPREPRCLV